MFCAYDLNDHFVTSVKAVLYIINDFYAAVLSSEGSASSKCGLLRKLNVFGRLRGFIYTELLMKIYYPHFLLSSKVYSSNVSICPLIIEALLHRQGALQWVCTFSQEKLIPYIYIA